MKVTEIFDGPLSRPEVRQFVTSPHPASMNAGASTIAGNGVAHPRVRLP